MNLSSNIDGSSGAPTPLDSSTCILLREGNGGGFEVFLMRRARGQSFMGGAYVYPGGRLDECDCSNEITSCARGLCAEGVGKSLQEPELADERALGLLVCGARELFEEAGVLLATTNDGTPLDLIAPEHRERFTAYRQQIHDGALSMSALAQRENLVYDFERLVIYDRWITPEAEGKKRFDTRFFLARMPAAQEAWHDNMELVDSIWVTPGEALEQQRSGKIVLMPPTFKTLEELSEHDSIDEVFSAAASREVYPILPQAFALDGGWGVKLPHDPEYTIAGRKRPPRPGETSRVVFRDGLWRTERGGE